MDGGRMAGGVLQVAFLCFEYDKIRTSQNAVESALVVLFAALAQRALAHLL